MLLAVLFANSEGNILVERYAGSSLPLIFLDHHRLFSIQQYLSSSCFLYIPDLSHYQCYVWFLFLFSIFSLVILIWNTLFWLWLIGFVGRFVIVWYWIGSWFAFWVFYDNSMRGLALELRWVDYDFDGIQFSIVCRNIFFFLSYFSSFCLITR